MYTKEQYLEFLRKGVEKKVFELVKEVEEDVKRLGDYMKGEKYNLFEISIVADRIKKTISEIDSLNREIKVYDIALQK